MLNVFQIYSAIDSIKVNGQQISNNFLQSIKNRNRMVFLSEEALDFGFQPFMINIIPNLIEHQTTGSAEDHIFNYKMRSNEFVITMQLSIWNLIEKDFFSFFSFR